MKRTGKKEDGGEKKSEKRKPFPITGRIAHRLQGKYPGRAEVEDHLRLLCTDRNIRERVEQYYAEKTGLMLKILAGGLAVSLVLILTAGSDAVLTGGYFLQRKEKAYIRELTMSTEEGTEEAVSVEIVPRRLTEAESRELLEQTKTQMEGLIIGENPSLEEVRSDLNLIQEIEGTPITVEWEFDNYESLNLDGSLRLENLKTEGSLTVLTARLHCEGEEAVYQAAVRTYPPLLTEEERRQQTIEEAIAVSQEESSQEELQSLPEKIDGQTVSWEEKASSTPLAALLLTLLSAAAVYAAKDRELGQEVRARDRQMQRDYARIVSKLVLLMGAGTAVRNAWEMIVRDYQKKRESGQEGLRYAYEEMALACHEMQNGVAETKAYENFGVRCRLPCYLKLSALLEQNLRKGSKGLSQILNAEVTEAFEQRKECALSQGEETSTRLLFPMVMMLAVVMLLILVPAAMSMQM